MKAHLRKPFIAKDFIEKAKRIHANKFDYSKVKDMPFSAYLKIEIGCPAHGYFWQEAGNHLLKGHGCKKCAQKATNEKLRKTLDVEAFVSTSKHIFGENTFDYSLVKSDCYELSRPMVTLICKQHGAFKVNAKDHLGQHGARCKRCSRKESYGEFLVRRVLEQKNIAFEQQKTFDGCRNPLTSRKLFFDFYLPDRNILIEFDGEYHFLPHGFSTRKETLNDTIKKDEIKNKFCAREKIKLVRIHYSDRNPKAIADHIERLIEKSRK